MLITHSVFRQSVHNVSAHQLQQHTIQIRCKMIQIVSSMNSWSKLFCIADNMVFYLGITLASFGMLITLLRTNLEVVKVIYMSFPAGTSSRSGLSFTFRTECRRDAKWFEYCMLCNRFAAAADGWSGLLSRRRTAFIRQTQRGRLPPPNSVETGVLYSNLVFDDFFGRTRAAAYVWVVNLCPRDAVASFVVDVLNAFNRDLLQQLTRRSPHPTNSAASYSQFTPPDADVNDTTRRRAALCRAVWIGY